MCQTLTHQKKMMHRKQTTTTVVQQLPEMASPASDSAPEIGQKLVQLKTGDNEDRKGISQMKSGPKPSLLPSDLHNKRKTVCGRPKEPQIGCARSSRSYQPCSIFLLQDYAIVEPKLNIIPSIKYTE